MGLTFLPRVMVASIRIRVLKNLALLCLALAFTSKAAQRPGEWTGDYSPCDRHTELLQRMHMDLGVRFSTSNQELAVEFARAMNFWATILDMNWRQENSRNCAIQVVDGSPGLFKPAEIARAQFLDSPSFQGWIAFNPRASLSANELFLTAVHELGHMLGLSHTENASSVMYFLRLDGPAFLDDADLAALATRHKLRVMVVPPMVSIPSGQSAQLVDSVCSATRADASQARNTAASAESCKAH